jgi:thioesterase domain-containing protein
MSDDTELDVRQLEHPELERSAPARQAALRRLQAQLLAMPPVVALGLRIDAYDGARLRLQAPLSANLNDKGCAFGGSLTSLMTLAGWGLVTTRLLEAGFEAEVYVADSEVRYRAPLYGDLLAEAVLADGESWERSIDHLQRRGKARLEIVATVALPEGGVATESRSRYVAIRSPRTE